MSTASNEWAEEFERVLRPFLPSLGQRAPLPADADLAALGLDSLRSIQLLFAVEDAFGVSLPDEMLGPALFATPETLWTGLRKVIGPAAGDDRG
ncbi:phosphopantetheine-binding protein [Actinophytocola glycyrrhizae]|uniref:Phosphopantetheine-binding protein n=1 Tax=Actinophytocola glycyrrhizae TaxID=2044873 RepID=A0ABV9S563_9PSEU